MGKGGSTIGYHYLGSVLFGLGRGPANALTAIKVGGKTAWEGNATTDAPQTINKPDLFGGKKKEGGLQGFFRSLMGSTTQVLPGAHSGTIGAGGPNSSATLPDLKASLGGDVPEFRGRHVVWYDGLLSSMNPYIKTWEFRRWRTTAGWHNDDPWYPAKATINLKDGAIKAMNPAHIVYQANTDPAWGRGISRADLDNNSFVYAANLFCNEGMGLCLQWMRRDEIGNFIQMVCDHAGMVQYTDRETGKICIKAIRDDYDPDDLPHFELDNGLLSLFEDDSGSSDNIADEIIVEGLDPITNQSIEGRAHNLAVRLFRGGPSTISNEYRGLPTIELCNRIAERERDAGGSGLRKFTVVLDRAGFRLHPGAVFKVSYPPRGISGIVLRVGEVDDGNMIDGRITVKAVQDVFSLPLTSFVTPVENTWEDPSDGVAEPAVVYPYEATYRDVYLLTSSGDAATIAEDDSRIVTAVARPATSNTEYNLLTRPEGATSFTETGPAFFTASAVLAAALAPLDDALVVEGENDFPDTADLLGTALLVAEGDRMEFMKIIDFDSGTSTFTVERGTVDTWPEDFSAGAQVWLVDDDLGFDRSIYSAGETIEAKVITRTATDELDEADADLLSLAMTGRAFRPYPPVGVKVNAITIYEPGTVSEGPVTWLERNRVTQADHLFGFFEATVTAEAGTTYEIDILETDATTVINTYTVTSPWTYDSTMQTADGTTGYTTILARIYAVRDGVRSREQRAFLIRGDNTTGGGGGYGLDYGLDYG